MARKTLATLATLASVAGASVLIGVLAHHGHTAPSGDALGHVGPAASYVRTTGSGATAGHVALGPIILPQPFGVVRRTQPLLTEWVVDSSLTADPAFVAAFRAEAPVAVGYLAEYSLAADRLGFAPAEAGLPVGEDRAVLLREAAQVQAIGTELPSGPITLAPPAPHRDRAVVVLTSDPDGWRRVIPPGPIPPRPTAGTHPSETSWYIIDVSPGSGSHGDAVLGGNREPESLTIDPKERGDLARSLARVFVDATGASWSTGSDSGTGRIRQ